MAPSTYDVITVGGGMAGSALAGSLAAAGLRVLVVEAERQFKDRVRGEQMQPWGVAEARTLGIHHLLRDTCGHDQPWIDMFLGPAQIAHRDLSSTTPQAAPHFNFYHPAMQETLIAAAARAGAEIWRGASVKDVRAGSQPAAVVEKEGSARELTARLVVGADGKFSAARKWGGFSVRQDEPFLMIAGLLVDDMRIPPDTGLIYMNPNLSQGAYLFPQGGGRVRAYSAYPVTANFRLQGDRDVPRFIEESIKTGAPAAIYDGIRPAGPLASFEAADTWVDHPYASGIALVGDAAAANDPSWGQGLSITLRDVRVLRDRLLETTNWDEACHRYADEHDRHYGVIHDVTRAFKDMFLRSGQAADARRTRALPLIAGNPMRVPDHLFSGPDLPWNEEVRRTFFAEDAVPSA
jgi:2-polyprenyl-6-methoxyphenol hydroxylase-like FAD-dependent oxidoreductase